MFGLTMAALGAYVAAILIFSFILYILKVVACWKIFEKAGQPGWKSLIPVYNIYTEYKLAWKTEGFWVLCAATLLSAFTKDLEGYWSYVAIVAGIMTTVVTVMMNYKLSKAFGHGIGFTLGLTFLPSIFELILGFGGDTYLGPQ